MTKDGKTRVNKRVARNKVLAKTLILAMPRRSLELIDSDFFEHPWLKKNIKSVLIQQAFKLFLAYERPWWRALGLVAGRSVTDLPIRQVYYFGTEGEQPNGADNLNSLLMASYNDISTVPFWKGLEAGDPFVGRAPACTGGVETGPEMETPATAEMVAIANKQVGEVHAMPQVPEPYAAVYHDWSGNPYGGGWHEWKANFRLDEVMCRMRKPVPEHDIHIVGEAYSYSYSYSYSYGQGWVEGALTTAESTLQDFFGLSTPEWLTDQDYALLPIPCPGGCGTLGGCIETGGADAVAATLAAATPNCCAPVEAG
ncbi:MAG: hypothetical protein ACI9K2_000250 [Myxococcota bacterium]